MTPGQSPSTSTAWSSCSTTPATSTPWPAACSATCVGLPDVSRVGLALTEGAGRRLRFVASDSVTDGDPPWCHIDAYDDVPLTAVTRTGEPVIGNLDQLEAAVPRRRGPPASGTARARSPRCRCPASARRWAGWCCSSTPTRSSARPSGGCSTPPRAVRPRRYAGSAPTRSAPAPPSAAPVSATGHRAELELDGDPRSAGAARRFLRERLAEWADRRRRRRHRPAVPLRAGEQRDHARPRQRRAHPAPRGRPAQRGGRATAAARCPVDAAPRPPTRTTDDELSSPAAD